MHNIFIHRPSPGPKLNPTILTLNNFLNLYDFEENYYQTSEKKEIRKYDPRYTVSVRL